MSGEGSRSDVGMAFVFKQLLNTTKSLFHCWKRTDKIGVQSTSRDYKSCVALLICAALSPFYRSRILDAHQCVCPLLLNNGGLQHNVNNADDRSDEGQRCSRSLTLCHRLCPRQVPDKTNNWKVLVSFLTQRNCRTISPQMHRS